MQLFRQHGISAPVVTFFQKHWRTTNKLVAFQQTSKSDFLWMETWNFLFPRQISVLGNWSFPNKEHCFSMAICIKIYNSIHQKDKFWSFFLSYWGRDDFFAMFNLCKWYKSRRRTDTCSTEIVGIAMKLEENLRPPVIAGKVWGPDKKVGILWRRAKKVCKVNTRPNCLFTYCTT